jgi:catechol-2,3-dioxygenase
MRPQDVQTDRRRFLAWTSASASFLAAHHGLVADGVALASESTSRARAQDEPGPRILGLELRSAAPLATMKAFYHGSLGLRLLDEGPDRLTIGAGETRITFMQAGPDDGEPFYHFAFNIPENKVVSARAWQKARTPLLPIPARLRDPAYPDDVVDYRHWNAHSIFFFDPAGNVVEYIARHDLGNARPGPFDSGDILHASEIGLVVDDVLAVASELKQVAGVDQYKGGSPQFTALGDEHGLLLVMQRGRIISFDAPEKKAVSVFRTSASLRGVRRARHRVTGFPYEVSVDG